MRVGARGVRGWSWKLGVGIAALLVGFLLWRPELPFAPTMTTPAQSEVTVVIDAGHGGEDGGAVSPSGAVESSINLEIALRLDAVLGLYGVDTALLRTEDVSLHDPGAQTLREKKASDLRNRAELVAAVPNALLVSIHQNTYQGSNRYHGAQVFYADAASSQPLAEHVQEILRTALDPGNTRQAAKLPGSVYLMEHVSCPAVLVECGFLSNPEEELLLKTSEYQTKLAAALAGALLSATPLL